MSVEEPMKRSIGQSLEEGGGGTKVEESASLEIDKFGLAVKGKGGDGLSGGQILRGSRGGVFDQLAQTTQEPGLPAPSVEGWVLFVSGLPFETTEDDLFDAFSAFGQIKNLKIPIDQKNCKCMGFAMVEFPDGEQCKKIIAAVDGKPFLSSPSIHICFAFVNPPTAPTEASTIEGGSEEQSSSVNRKRDRKEDPALDE